MSPDAFIKTDNPIVNRRKKDLSESISWGEHKGRMSWCWEPPASRSWHEEPYGDQRYVEVARTSRAHHSDSDTKETSCQQSDEDIYERRQRGAEREENKHELQKWSTTKDEETKRNQEEKGPKDDYTKTKRSKKDKKQKHDNKDEAEKEEPCKDQEQSPRWDADLYTPENVAEINDIIEGANFSDQRNTDFGSPMKGSTEIGKDCIGIAPENDNMLEDGIPTNDVSQQMHSPTETGKEESTSNQAIVDQISYTWQRVKEGNNHAKAIWEEVTKMPQHVNEVVREL